MIIVRYDRLVLDLSWVHRTCADYLRSPPSIDPVLMIRMCHRFVFGLRSERLLCREVQ